MKMLSLFIALLLMGSSFASKYYGENLCAYPQFKCIKVKSGQSWKKLFPDEEQRDLVQRLNRTYNRLYRGKSIVVPVNLAGVNIFDISPFPLHLDENGEKKVIIDQDKLAWGAYDSKGNLVKWGPISSGRDKCVDSNSSCRTITGIFRIYSKENQNCRSNTYDNARMPFCMFFHKGFAMHGSNDIPGRRASHGCVRMFTKDALWLNKDFVYLSNNGNDYLGTKVIVRPVTQKD